MTAPPIAYFGAKQRTASRIVDLFPPHVHYVEPFCGSLSVLLAKPPAKLETVNDLDRRLMTFWRVLRDQPDDLERVCTLTPHSRAELESCADIPDGLPDLEVARRVWVVLTQGRSRALVRNSGWRFSIIDPGTSLSRYLAGYVQRIAPAAARLADVTLECRDALEVIDAYGVPGALLYVDPPYLRSARAGSNYYGHELESDADHHALLELVKQSSAHVALSGYASDLYDTALADWERITIPAYSQSDSARTEVVWMNYQPAPTLFDQEAA